MLNATWRQKYIQEFFCDMFAAYVFGPAYAWAFLQVVLAKGRPLYSPGFGGEESHPSDEARIRAILLTLELLGETTIRQQISEKWEPYRAIMGYTLKNLEEEKTYDYCYPNPLLRELAKLVIYECRSWQMISYRDQAGLKRRAKNVNVPLLVQEAWNEFHNNPLQYPLWETQRVKELKNT